MADLITIVSSALPEGARVLSFRGVDYISRPYEIEIFLVLDGDEADSLDLADAIGSKARMVLDRANDSLPPYIFAGILATLDLLHVAEGRTLLRAVLVPRLWQLGLSQHSRIFTKKSLPEVIESILDDNGLWGSDYELKLGSYETEEHICQYRESDLDFLSRWMEREGVFYYFEHSEDGEKIIFCDDKSYPEDMLGRPVRYFPQLGNDHSASASFRSFTCRHTTLPSQVKLRDYDYARPNLNVHGNGNGPDNGAGEVNRYGERFFSPSGGDRLAKLRAEEYKTRAVVFNATGTRSHLRSGYTFNLEEHPRAGFDTRYLATEVRHWGNQAVGASHFKTLIQNEHEETYYCEVTAILADTQFRAPSSTPWPRIYGYENATVCGPGESEYAQIDDQGRYNVKIRFDEGSLKDGKASTFVRMMQPHGGSVEGFHFPLRKGTEVVLSFLGGDPDRPVISGVVPNALTPSPVTSANHTKNVIQTGGRNRIEMEDLSGQQWIHVSTPYENTYIRMGLPFDGTHELELHTKKDSQLFAGANYDLRVGQLGSGTWDALIKNDWKTHVQTGGLSIGVVNAPGGPSAGVFGLTSQSHISLHTSAGNYSLNVDAGTSTRNIFGNDTTTVANGNYTVNVNTGNTKIDTKGTTHIKSVGAMTLETDATCDVKVKSNMTLTVDGGVTKTVNGSETVATHGPFKKLYSSNNVNVTGGFKSDTFLGLSNSNAVGASISTFLGGKVTLEASGAFSATYAYKLEIAGGVALSFKFGAALSINSAVELTVKPTKIESGAAKISQLPTRLAMMGLRYHLSGMHVLS